MQAAGGSRAEVLFDPEHLQEPLTIHLKALAVMARTMPMAAKAGRAPALAKRWVVHVVLPVL